MPRHPNALLTAEAVGQASNGIFGGLVLRGCEVAFLLAATRKAKFSGRCQMRLNQSVLIQAVAGIGKSFVADFFFGQCCGVHNMLRPASRRTGKEPRLIEDDGQGSWARWRGGVNTYGEPIKPLILDADFVLVGELGAVIGEDRNLNIERVRGFGTLVEERRMSVSFNKLYDLDEETFAEFAKNTKAYGYQITLDPRGYSFTTNASFIVLTTPLDEASLKKLKKAGFISRFDNLHIELANDEQLDVLRDFGRRGLPDASVLRALNQDVWNTEFKDIPYPPMELMEDYIQDWLCKETAEISGTSHAQPLEVANLRDVGNLARLMAAHAISRLFASREVGDRSPVETLTYTKADADFAKAYLQAHMNNLRIQAVGNDTAKVFDGIPEKAHQAMKETLLENADEDVEGLPTIGTVDLFYERCKKLGLSQGTAANYFSMFRTSKLVRGGRYSNKTFVITNETYLTKQLKIRPNIKMVYDG
jgi:hypothetical protein